MTEQPKEESKIGCQACGAESTYQEALHERPVDRYADKGLTEIGLLCPTCGTFTRSHFMDDALREEHGKLKTALSLFTVRQNEEAWDRYQTARKVYARHFDRTQARWQKKMGEG